MTYVGHLVSLICMCKERVEVIQQVTSPDGQETRMAVYPKSIPVTGLICVLWIFGIYHP